MHPIQSIEAALNLLQYVVPVRFVLIHTSTANRMNTAWFLFDARFRPELLENFSFRLCHIDGQPRQLLRFYRCSRQRFSPASGLIGLCEEERRNETIRRLLTQAVHDDHSFSGLV